MIKKHFQVNLDKVAKSQRIYFDERIIELAIYMNYTYFSGKILTDFIIRFRKKIKIKTK